MSVIDFLANRYATSVLTRLQTKQFTLSEQTLKIAKNLQQPVTISYWDQSNKFEGARDHPGSATRITRREITIQYNDTDKKRTQAIAAGVKTLGTIFIDVGNKHQEAKALTEEDITGAMVRALKGGQRMACFVLGSGEHSLADSDRITSVIRASKTRLKRTTTGPTR